MFSVIKGNWLGGSPPLMTQLYLGVFIYTFSLFLCLPSASAKELVVGMGNFKPYFIESEGSGVFPDLVTAVFREMPEYEPKFVWALSNNSLWSSFEAGRLDAVSNLFDSVEIQGCRTEPVFRFRDVAVTRASSGLQLRSIQDLKGKRVVAFQGAKGFFGKDYTQQLDSSNYEEVGKPTLQAKMLWMKRYDVSVGDLYIFLEATKTLSGEDVSPNDFTVHNIFPVISSRLGFRDETMCGKFNEALKKVKASGEFEAIYQGYLNKLGYGSSL